MTDCNMFKGEDGGVVREYLNSSRGMLEEPIMIKFWTETKCPDPTKGVAKVFIYKNETSKAVVSEIQQVDIVYSGGVYLLGDIKVQTQLLLKEVDDATQCPGDRIIWRGHEYRIVGRVIPHYLGKYILYEYVFRRV